MSEVSEEHAQGVAKKMGLPVDVVRRAEREGITVAKLPKLGTVAQTVLRFAHHLGAELRIVACDDGPRVTYGVEVRFADEYLLVKRHGQTVASMLPIVEMAKRHWLRGIAEEPPKTAGVGIEIRVQYPIVKGDLALLGEVRVTGLCPYGVARDMRDVLSALEQDDKKPGEGECRKYTKSRPSVNRHA